MGYAQVYGQWQEDPEGFWMAAAGGIDWAKPPTQALNASRDARSLVASAYRRPVPLDEAAVRYLALQGVTLQTVLPLGQVARSPRWARMCRSR